jgi:hypothetical protein
MKDGRVPLVQPSRFYPALGIEPEDTAQAVRDDARVDVAPLALRDDSVKVAGTEAGAAAPQVSVIRDNRPASREGGRDEPLGKEDVDRPKVERPRPDGLRVPEHAALPPRSAMATADAPAHVRSMPGDRLPLKNECLAGGRHRHARRQDILNAAESFGDEKLLAGNPIAPQSLEGRPGPEAMGQSGAVQERARRGGLETYCGVKVRSLESSAARSWTCPAPTPGFSGKVNLPNLRRDKGGSVRPVSSKLALAPQGDSPCFDASRRLAVIGPRRVRRPGARTARGRARPGARAGRCPRRTERPATRAGPGPSRSGGRSPRRRVRTPRAYPRRRAAGNDRRLARPGDDRCCASSRRCPE